jgi:putative methionine-R-sulfoxide reductase with GAF domain
MSGLKGKYIFILACVIVLAAYQLLISFNKLPYFFSAQDITVIILVILSIFLISISTLLQRITALLSYKKESLYIRLREEAEADLVPELKSKGEKDYSAFFVNLQRYIKGISGFDELVKKLLVATAKTTNSERVSILFYNKKQNELNIYRTIGWKERELSLIADIHVKPGEGIAGRVFLDEAPIIMNDVRGGVGHEKIHKYRSNSYISFPVFAGSNIVGVLNLTEKDSGHYSDREVNIIKFLTIETSIHLMHIPINTALIN